MKQDERTPGPWRRGVNAIFAGPEDGSTQVAYCERESDAAFIVQVVNAYTSTEGLREALMLAEKADRIHSKCSECTDYAQPAELCEKCFPSADDARVARRNVLKALGVKMRDVDRCAPDAARTALAGSAGGRIKVTARGVSIRVHTWALAELASEMAGPGAEIRYVPEGSDDGWCVWTEGETWPDEDDFRYHLFALEVKRLRRERHSLAPSAGVTVPSEVDGK